VFAALTPALGYACTSSTEESTCKQYTQTVQSQLPRDTSTSTPPPTHWPPEWCASTCLYNTSRVGMQLKTWQVSTLIIRSQLGSQSTGRALQTHRLSPSKKEKRAHVAHHRLQLRLVDMCVVELNLLQVTAQVGLAEQSALDDLMQQGLSQGGKVVRFDVEP